MKLTLAVKSFELLAKRALQFASKGKDISPGYGLLHIEITESGSLRLSAHNAGAGTKVSMQVDTFEPGIIALSAEHVDKIIGILPKGRGAELSMSSGRGPKVKFSVGTVKMSLPKAEVDDFPPLPRPPKDGWFEVSDHQLSEVIKRTLWAMCKDESRPALSGVHLCHETSETTDGHMMAHKRPGFLPKGKSVVVPGEAWHKLRSFIEDKDIALRMSIQDDRRVWLRAKDWAVFTTLIAQNYPDMSPLAFDIDGGGWHEIDGKKIRVHWIHLNRQETLAAVRRIVGASVSQEEKKIGAAVKFEVRDGSLHLVSHYPFDDLSNSILVDEKVDWGEGSITVDDMSGFEALAGIGLYSTYMKMALESLSSNIVRVMWAESRGDNFMPVQFHDDDVGMKSLVMPRRL
jgi:DNA polymerase III sliding clamp (beta) subunit (PCNA family)